MAGRGEKVIRGMINAARGITKAYVDALTIEDQRQQQEKEMARQAQIDSLNAQYRQAQITNLLEEKPPKTETPKGFSLSAGQTRFEPTEEGGFAKVAEIPPKPDKDGTKNKPQPKISSGSMGIAERTLRRSLPKWQKDANEAAIEAGKEPPYPEPEITPQQIVARADSLETFAKTGNWPEVPIETQFIEKLQGTDPDLVDWDMIKKDYPELDIEVVKDALRRK